MAWLCGVDGFRDRWRAVLGNSATGESRLTDLTLADIFELPEAPEIIAVDIPIGLPDVTFRGGRACDRLARGLLGPRRGAVFSPMGRICLDTCDRAEASQFSIARGGIGIGAQCWGLKKKLVEIDTLMTPAKQGLVHEVHPELSFREMNGGHPLGYNKKSAQGQEQRIDLLKRSGFPESFSRPMRTLHTGRDDFLDACAALWTAERICRGIAKRIPNIDESEQDRRGLDMAIWI